MRLPAVALCLLPLAMPARADACPASVVATDVATEQAPATAAPCLTAVDFDLVRRLFQVGYAIGASSTTRSGFGHAAAAFAGIEVAYAMQFGGDADQPSYEVELASGAALQRIASEDAATGLVTHARARLGPARVRASMTDEGRGNLAVFPLTMELAHTGELAARPQLAARPELARGSYGRERLELTTRLLRLEGAGSKASTSAPGATAPTKPSSWALDFIPLHGGLDIAMQDGTRFETTVGGAMLGVVEHTMGATLDVLGVEHRRIDRPMGEPTGFDTVWVLRLEGVDPTTGSQYYMGWGEVIAMNDHEALAMQIDPEGQTLSIGGFGWFSSRRSWGGFGAQYKREPFVTMAGDVALEDRMSGEVYVPNRFGMIAARVFGARTMRLVDDTLRHDTTAGVEIDATYSGDGLTGKLGLELGRTFYTALDGAQPDETGFAATVSLAIQHTGQRVWRR